MVLAYKLIKTKPKKIAHCISLLIIANQASENI